MSGQASSTAPIAPFPSSPAPAEVKAARKAARLTQTQAGALVYVKLRTWQQWEAATGSKDHTNMHPAFWELFQIKLAGRAQQRHNERNPAHD